MSTPPPSFAALGVAPALCQTLAAEGLVEPTPIQVAAIPPLLEGVDLRVEAATGTGKTLAVGLPLLMGLDLARRVPQALVVVPTRELAAQIVGELRRFGRGLGELRVLALVGGEPGSGQARALETGAHVVVGTPGRLLDHLEKDRLDVYALSFVVLDEADRLLDLGFLDAVDEILARVRAVSVRQQTVLSSATFPVQVQRLAERVLRGARAVSVGQAPAALLHASQRCASLDARLPALRDLLVRLNPASTLIFCNQKLTVDEVAEALPGAMALHGDHEQDRRNDVLAAFRNGSARVLVATDVAGRGLDVDGVELVVHFDLPPNAATATHRSGRTGRAGAPGLSVALVPAGRESRWEELLGPSAQRVALPGPLHAERHPRWETLRISAGRKEKIRRGDLLGALTQEGGLAPEDIGLIEVGERVSWVALRPDALTQALQRLQKVKGSRVRMSVVG